MEVGSQSHSPHYHFLHYAGTDPLVDHTPGSHKDHTRSEVRDTTKGGQVGRYRKHTGAQHTNSRQHTKTVGKNIGFDQRIGTERFLMKIYSIRNT